MQQAKAAADKLARLQSRQAHLRKDRDRHQLQSTVVASRIPQALSDIPSLQLVLDKHFAFRDYQELRLRSLPAELATLYLQLRLPYGQPEILARIQASLVEQGQLHTLHPLENQRIDSLAREVQDARDSVSRNQKELGHIKGILERLQTESDSLTSEIQAVYPKVHLGFAYNPKTVDLLQAGFEHDELTSAAIPQFELEETVRFLKSDTARSTVVNIPASRRVILAAAYSNNRRDLAETKAKRDKFLKEKYPPAEAERRIRSLDLTKPLQFRPDPPKFKDKEDKAAWSEREGTLADIIHKGPGEGGNQWVEKDFLENVGFLSNKGKGLASHRDWTKTVITSVIGAALAEAQADPAFNSLVQSQPEPLSPSDQSLKVLATPSQPAAKPAAESVSLPAASLPAVVSPLAAIKTKRAAVPAVESKPAPAASKPAAAVVSPAAVSKPAAAVVSPAAASKPAAAVDSPAAASKPAAAVDSPAAAPKPALTVSPPAAIASVVEPAAAKPASHPAPTLPEVAVSLPAVNSLDTVEEESLETVLAEQPPTFAFDVEPLTEELDWGFELSPVAPKDSSQASGFSVVQSPLDLPAAAAASVATCLSPALVLSAGVAVAAGAVLVSAGLSTDLHPEIPLPAQETFRVPDPVQPKGKAAIQDLALASVAGISRPSPTVPPVDRSQEDSSSVGATTPITPAVAADRRDQRLNRHLRARLLTFFSHVLEPKEADETWEENNISAQGWIDGFEKKEGSTQSGRPSP